MLVMIFPVAKAARVSFQTKLESAPGDNRYLIETVSEYFVSARCQKSPR